MAHVAQVEALEEVQRLQHGVALRVGRALVDLVAAVVDVDRLGLEGLVAGQILLADDAAVGAHAGDQRLGHRPGVEAGRALRRDGPQRLGQVGVLDDVAHHQRLAVAEPDPGGRRELAELALAAVEPAGQVLGDRVALLGHFDGRRQHVGQGLGPVLLQRQRRPADRAGHRNRQPAVVGHAAVRVVVVDGRGLRRVAGAVDELHLLGLGQVDEREHVGAEAGHPGLDLALDRPGGDRRVDGVAAGLQHAHADLGGQRMAGGDHALGAHHRGPPAGLRLRGVGDERGERERQEEPTGHAGLLVVVGGSLRAVTTVGEHGESCQHCQTRSLARVGASGARPHYRWRPGGHRRYNRRHDRRRAARSAAHHRGARAHRRRVPGLRRNDPRPGVGSETRRRAVGPRRWRRPSPRPSGCWPSSGQVEMAIARMKSSLW